MDKEISEHLTEKKETKIADKIIDGILNIFYSKDKTKLYLLLLFVAGFILRLIAASNIGLHPDDANHAVIPVRIIGSGKLEEVGQSSALWYYIQDFFYKIFGTSQFSSRLAAAIFGSFAIILMFVFAKHVFKSKKIGLIAAVLTAFSPWFVKMTMPEMDIAANFFIIFSGLFIFKFTEEWKKKHLILSAIFVGIAIMIKVYSLFFAFSYFLFLIYSYYKKKELNKKAIKSIFVFLAVIFIFCIPTLTYNYLLYKDKGFMDLMFTNFLKIGVDKAKEIYSWGGTNAGFMPPADFKGFFFGKQVNWKGDAFYNLPGFLLMFRDMIREEPLIIILGLLGLLMLLFKRSEKYFLFFLFNFPLPFIFLGTIIPMLKHQTFVPFFFIPIASYFLSSIDDRIKAKFPNFKLKYLIMLIIIFNLLWLGRAAFPSPIYTKSGESQLINYKIKEINPNSLVIVDSRTYRGYMAWMFNDRYYLESSLFGQAVQESQKYGTLQSIETYFVECVEDDCGWGTVKGQPDFNKSMEGIVEWFANSSKMTKEIGETNKNKYYLPFFTKRESTIVYRVYKTNLMLNPSILQIAKSTHVIINTFPVGYDRTIAPMFDDYQIHNSLDSLLSKFAFLIMYTALLFSFFSLLYLGYIFIKEETQE